jgi:filamentous hemagglutinin
VAVGATVIGVGADVVEQAMRPDMGKVPQDALLSSFQEWADSKLPGVAPVTNEVIEAWKASGTSEALNDWTNQQWNAFLDRTKK